MAVPRNLLQLLQTRTVVDCDTMDVEVPKALGPFVDCTSNQAIAYFELLKPIHVETFKNSALLASKIAAENPTVSPKQLGVEIAMVALQLEISRYVTGFVHVQTNPYDSFSTEKTLASARRIVSHFKLLDPAFDTSRVCIKIPSTWSGLQACKVLESTGITTLATTLFTMVQTHLAGEVGCHYIAPYVNELKVHFEPGFVDHNKAQALCFQAQQYYQAHGIKTQVLPASLTSIDEIMELAGVHHITIAPALLQQLATTPASTLSIRSLFDDVQQGIKPDMVVFGDGPAARASWKIAFTREGAGEGERKLTQAINIFCDMQDKIEAMIDEIQSSSLRL